MIRYITILILTAFLFVGNALAQKSDKSKKEDQIVYIIDGVRQPDDFDASTLDMVEIKSINVFKGKEALEKYGTESVIEIYSKETKKPKDGNSTSVKVFKNGDNYVLDKKAVIVSDDYTDFEHLNSSDKYLFEYSSKSSERNLSYDYNKSLRDNTFEKDYKIAIDENLESMSISVTGSLRSGSVILSLKDVNGKTIVSAVEIDEFGSLSMRKKLKFQDNIITRGEWTLHVKAKNATGSFRVSLTGY